MLSVSLRDSLRLDGKVPSLSCFRKVHIYVKVVWIVRIRGHFHRWSSETYNKLYHWHLRLCLWVCMQVRGKPDLLHVKIFNTLNSIFFLLLWSSQKKNPFFIYCYTALKVKGGIGVTEGGLGALPDLGRVNSGELVTILTTASAPWSTGAAACQRALVWTRL